MSKIKLMTILGTRPEIIRLSEIIKKCDKFFVHTLVHTGQNYDFCLNRIFFDDFGLRQPDYFLNAADDNLGQTMGNIISESYKLMQRVKPDAVLVLGDTNSALCTISAKRLKIPIFHMEAGNRCFDENVPEETNRKIVDCISDVNLCYSENARRNLSREGQPQGRTFVTGSPMTEVLSVNKGKIYSSDILERLNLKKGKYILLSAHREENVSDENNFLSLMNAVNAIAKKYEMPVIYSVHPRSEKIIKEKNFVFSPLVKMIKPLGFFDYNNLQINSFCVLSDSGTLGEEASFFKSFPAVSIRTSTERQEALENGNFILGGIDEEKILSAVSNALALWQEGLPGADVPDYSDENVSAKVIKIIQSFVGIIK